MVGPISSAFRMFIVLILLTGFLYPAIVTSIAHLFFHEKANGSLIEYQKQIVGSHLIGQLFTDSRYFWGRPSAVNYHAESSGGSNLGPSNPIFLNQVEARIKFFQGKPPIDFITMS